MTREKFTQTWCPFKQPGRKRDVWVDHLNLLVSAAEADAREKALEEAAKMCECDAINQQSRGHDARAAEAYRLAVAIRGLMDQQKEKT